MQGKCGPHGELFFFLIQTEPATEQVGETFSPFFNADTCISPLFSADVLKKCALIALHMMAEGGRDKDGFQVPGLGANGGWVVQTVQCGRVKAKLGRRMKMRLLPPLVKAMCAMARCTSSVCMGPVTEHATLRRKTRTSWKNNRGEGRMEGEKKKKERRERREQGGKGERKKEKQRMERRSETEGRGRGSGGGEKKLPGEAEAGTVRGETTGAFECRPRVFPVEGC